MSRFVNIFNQLPTNREKFRVVLMILLAFVMLSVSLIFFTFNTIKPYMGIVLARTEQGWMIESIDANGSANKAGIKEGQKPIEINGQPAQAFLDKYEKVGKVLGMLIKELTIVDDNGQLKSVTLRDVSPSWQSQMEQITLFVICLTYWITGFYVFFKKPKNVAAFLLCLSGLIFGLDMSAITAADRAIPTALQIEIVTSVIGPWLLLHFFLVLPEERPGLRKNPLVYLIYLPAVITLVLFPLFGYADGQTLPSFRSFRLLEYSLGFFAAVSIAVFNYIHALSPRTRQQMKIILISCVLALLPFLLLSILPEVVQGRAILPAGFSILFIGLIPLGMGYAIVTQKLLDIDIVIRRGLVYALITIIMTGILSAGIFTILTFQESFGFLEEIILALAMGGIATALIGPLKKRIEILVDKFIYKDRYDYRQIIQSLSISLNSVKDFTDISRLIVGTTVHTLNLSGGSLFVKTHTDSFEIAAAEGIFTDTRKQERLRGLISQRNSLVEFPNSASTFDSEIAFMVRLQPGEKEIGVLCLSLKISGQKFSSDDLFLIQGISSVSAIALQSAMLIRDVSLRDTFVLIASHELRTPLTAIIGYADLLQHRDPPDATRRKWLKNIVDNGQRITSMANDLLNVTRIQSGKIGLKLERLQLSNTLDEQLELIRESSNKHEFVVDIEPDLPYVIVDRDKFGQVIGNLLNNAIKYSPNGGQITLSAHCDSLRDSVVVSVTDEGIGISIEDINSLFRTFHRIQRPETQGIRGSGLGLFIAKEWTEAMGGKMWVESELNKGSTFSLAVPLQIDHP